MFFRILFLLVKKMEIQFYLVSFCPLNSPKSITNSLIAHGSQAIVRKVKEATSEIHEELQGADESYWAVFPVKFTEQLKHKSICC